MLNSINAQYLQSKYNGYKIDTEQIKQALYQADKKRNIMASEEDSVHISEAGRSALQDKLPGVNQFCKGAGIKTLSSISSYSVINDFEKMVSNLSGATVSGDFATGNYPQEKVNELKAGFAKEDDATTDTFDRHVNQMACAYHLMKNTIEEKYSNPNREQEYYIADDGSVQELTREKEIEMLNRAYENHSQFMAASTEIWANLQDFKVQTIYHSNAELGAQKSTETSKNAALETGGQRDKSIQIKEEAYRAFMSAVSSENIGLLAGVKSGFQHVKLNLGISDSARNELNGIWDYYAGRG